MLFSTTGLTRSTFELEADDGSTVVPLVEDSEESDLFEDNIVCCVPLVVDEQEDEVEEVEGKEEEEEEVEGRRYLLSFVEPELMERSRGNS